MGRHRAVELPQKPSGATAVGSRGKGLPWWKRWFKGDWWWLAGFTLGLFTGTMLAFSAFLWWLTGDMGRFLDSAMERLFG